MKPRAPWTYILIAVCIALLLSIMSPYGCGIDRCYIDYWVATDGSDSGTGTSDDPFLTLARARDAVRSDVKHGQCVMNVNIKGGTYRLESPLVLDSSDSGTSHAEIVYRAVAGEEVVISGGQRITGWELHDVGKNIWKAQAQVATETMPRQLYVNGVRATRARTVDYPNYYLPTDTGYFYLYLGGTDPQIPPTWNNPTASEAVTVTQWKMMRCPIAEVVGGNDVIMQHPCWHNANVYPAPWNFHLLSWFENAYEFIDEPGEWYLDPVTQMLYYKPLDGEDMTTAEVELPVLETLVRGNGTVSQPIRYIHFEGLNFQYATWLGPNTADGYALDQSGFHLTGEGHDPNDIGHDPNVTRTPGNVSFIYAQHIAFTDNDFSHLGAVALDFDTGSQENRIINNTFSDISSAAIQLGGVLVQDHHPDDPAQVTRDNVIENNLIEYAGQDFYDTPGIYIGFTTRSIVQNNTIRHVPWAGIAIGWGWGLLDPGGYPGLPHASFYDWGRYDTPSTAVGNQILNNLFDGFLEKLWDAGAIYSSGFQGTSMDDGQLISGNVAQNKRAAAGGNTYYTDGGSRYVTVKENVSINNPQGTVDFGPCWKDSSFITLCPFTGIVPYGADMGGCVPYGDLLFEMNYLRDQLTFYDICENTNVPNYPVDMSFVDNVKVSSSSEVPAEILNAAGRQSE